MLCSASDSESVIRVSNDSARANLFQSLTGAFNLLATSFTGQWSSLFFQINLMLYDADKITRRLVARNELGHVWQIRQS
jgi:hypothetical protein